MIQGEATTININPDENIKEIKIANKRKEIKISQYADGSNFFLTKEKSVENVLHYFQKLHKATAATINLDKATILPINTDQTSYLQENLLNTTVKKQCENIKILGMISCKNLKEVIMLN